MDERPQGNRVVHVNLAVSETYSQQPNGRFGVLMFHFQQGAFQNRLARFRVAQRYAFKPGLVHGCTLNRLEIDLHFKRVGYRLLRSFNIRFTANKKRDKD